MKSIGRIIFLLLLISSCKRDDLLFEDQSFVSVVNTSPQLPGLSVYIDTVFQTRIPYRASIRNVQLAPGLHVISIKDSIGLKTYLSLPVQEFVKDATSTIVVYDTLHPIDSTVKAIRLSDDLTLAPSGFVKVRFINAAPFMSPVDVTFLRTSVNPFDSITFSTQPYIGNAVNVQSVSAFNNIPIGTYVLKIKSAGTQDTLLNTLKLSVANLAGAAGISGITTFYLTGGVQSRPLEVGLFRHYP